MLAIVGRVTTPRLRAWSVSADGAQAPLRPELLVLPDFVLPDGAVGCLVLAGSEGTIEQSDVEPVLTPALRLVGVRWDVVYRTDGGVEAAVERDVVPHDLRALPPAVPHVGPFGGHGAET